MDLLLADETILRIFGYLDATDLARLQSVNSHLRSLAKDRHVWKRLFYLVFVRPTLHIRSTSPGSHGLSDPILPTLKELKSLLLHQRLPSRKAVAGDGGKRIQSLPRRFYDRVQNLASPTSSGAQAEDIISDLYQHGVQGTYTHHLLDWEQLYRVSTNWQAGNFAISQLTPSESRDNPVSRSDLTRSASHTIVRVSHSYIFTTSPPAPSVKLNVPSICVYLSEPEHTSPLQTPTTQAPKDLDPNTPIATFSSQELRRLKSLQHGNEMVDIRITEIAIDAAVSGGPHPQESLNRKRKASDSESCALDPLASILVAYSTGHVSLFSLRAQTTSTQNKLEVDEDCFFRPPSSSSADHVAMAALHSPALVLCSNKFDIMVYRITSPSSLPDLVQRMSSYRCSWPATLRLKKLPYHEVAKRTRRCSSSSSPERPAQIELSKQAAFRVTLVYSTPSYPASWSVSVQELVVHLDLDAAPAHFAQVISRHASAKHPFRSTPIDLRGRSMLASYLATDSYARGPTIRFASDSDSRGNVSMPDSRTTSLTYDDPFVVVGASDNSVEVYELLGATKVVRRGSEAGQSSVARSATATPALQRGSLRLVHRRSLHGHTGSVSSVSLEDGRCVSGSADGSVMVWSLGDRSNETDSIASVMRNARSQLPETGTGSTSSTILEEEEDDEAASHMTHVLTLRTPMDLEHQHTSTVNDEATDHARTFANRRLGPSLGQLVRSRVLDRQTRGKVRWVSTGFDKIVSIVTYADAHAVSQQTVDDAVAAGLYPTERVQVWSFG